MTSRTAFLRTGFDLLPLDAAVDAIAARAASGEPFVYVATPNAQAVVRKNGGKAPAANAAFDEAWLSTNDSRVLALIARRLFGLDLPTAAGSDITEALFERVITPETPLTIIGGDEELEAALREQFGIRRIARHEPPFGLLHNTAAQDEAARFIVDNPAPFVFLVVGTPQSEIVARRAVALGASRGVGLCVGGSLNFVTGRIPRAPEFYRRHALEWLHRLMLNPRGHARRVFVESGPVLWLALRARLDARRHAV